ncbi:MAG: transporter [Segetibacter sp.]
MKKSYIILLFALASFVSKAQDEKDEMEADRPGVSFSSKVVEKNRFQLEVGIQKEHDNTSGHQDRYLYPTALLKYGLTKKLELRVLIEDEGDYEFSPNKHKVASGLQPIKAGLKFNLFDEKGCLPSTSLLAHAAIPKLASPDFKSDYVAPAFYLLMENSLSKKVSLTYNIGAEWEPDDVHANYLVTLSPQLEISEKFKVFAEVYSYFSSEENAQYSWDAGFLYKIKPNLQFDFYGGHRITKSAPDNFIEAGFSFRLPR